ncbi:MAG: TetR/AcrR family transcriptional regulator [Ancalomicrobiaceae bacterium]|nr:TetR/AcrR family transcriptional regulator [Ancalomicrobiaceae bacterium]
MAKCESDVSPRSTPRRSYHHGRLREALVKATVELIEARGLDSVSLREVAKLAGVSSAAPFRHFPSRLALLTAVAEEAQDRLIQQIEQSLAAVEGQNALQRFRAIGRGFLLWAITNPTHFQVISNRHIITYETSSLRGRNDQIRRQMSELMVEAAAQNLLRPGDVSAHEIGARALVYGLARMYVDGQFPSWGVSQPNPLDVCNAVFDQFIASISV